MGFKIEIKEEMMILKIDKTIHKIMTLTGDALIERIISLK